MAKAQPQNDLMSTLENLIQQRSDASATLEGLDKAIDALQGLTGSPKSSVRLGSVFSYGNLSIYEASVKILSRKQPLDTDQMVDALKAGGYKLGKNGRMIVATTLYKAVKMKKDCKIARAGIGKWKLA